MVPRASKDLKWPNEKKHRRRRRLSLLLRGLLADSGRDLQRNPAARPLKNGASGWLLHAVGYGTFFVLCKCSSGEKQPRPVNWRATIRRQNQF